MLQITRYRPEDYTDALIARLQPLREAMHAERDPDDPPPTPEGLKRQLAGIPAHIGFEVWLASLPGGEVVGTAHLRTFEMDGRRHLASGGVSVLPTHRRKGLGRRLLSVIRARETGRTTLTLESLGRIPAGGAFLTALGAAPGLIERESRLNLSTLDQSQLEAWSVAPSGFSPVWWDDRCPDERLESAVELARIFNDIPVGALDMGNFQLTPELLRAEEASRQQKKTRRWTLAVQEDASGRLVGLTELDFNPERSAQANQQFTGVESAYRGKGLGLYLKATMLKRLLSERPEVRHIATGNAVQNQSMRKINDALGFHLHDELTVWQLSL